MLENNEKSPSKLSQRKYQSNTVLTKEITSSGLKQKPISKLDLISVK